MRIPSSLPTVPSSTRSLVIGLAVIVAFLVLRFSGADREADALLKEVLTPTTLPQVTTTVPVLTTGVSTTQAVLWPKRVPADATVTRVIDGDTVDVVIDGSASTTRVRLLGINTPESVDPRRPVQCFGKEASRALKALVEGKRIALVEDPQADDRDRYGRWLRTLVLDETMDVNATLVRQGYAQAYVDFPMTKARRAELRALQRTAETEKVGLWNEATCAGEAYR